MAEEQKPVEVAAPVVKEETAPVVVEETPAVEAAPVAVVEDKPAEEAKPAEAEEAEAAKEEDKKEEEAKPVEEGFLGHKAQGASFPKNLIPSKTFFFFGNEAVETEVLAAYKKAEKHVEVAQHNIAWAAHTGKGLLFIGDKKAPHGVINLADATEPETDGSHKFHFSAKGNKHTFKANSAAERDNWVAQLKAKIAEAKELAATVTESEATTPLAVDVSSPATVPTETTEAAVTNGETKKDKEKRKSSLPFTFGKRDKSPGPGSEGEEKSGKGAFSKLRATIKGKGAAKPEDKPAEEAKEEEAIKEEEETPAAAATTEEASKEEAVVPKPEEAEAENKPEAAAAPAPVVTAAA
ncbi:hypothetical protein M440DRAFT_1462463 [Trichoderma longibrachiatum ATCC 18648]|uniref:PH domain-containing protein n=1 Tax=Trichoderma longibrachiatum ATCC 18648 TaxID=983965 RepID=A0A2T4C8S1_TRILO|nr:hypothetical protein M440DRAFT_1462463 [Trichoderma longibrachiatum ATCC 18648]